MQTFFRSVILIDDDEVNNYITSKIIRKLNICEELKIASNGAEGLKLVKERGMIAFSQPDLILLDINMPVMNGHEFLKELGAIIGSFRQKFIISMLTTSTHEDDIAKVKGCNVAGYLNKPLTKEKIQEFLDRIF